MNNSFCYDARSQHFTFNLFKISQSSSTLSPKKSNYNWIELDAVDSTNNYAMGLVHAGTAQHGTVVLAHHQTKGKGQRGKVWATEPGANLSFSIVVKPGLLINQAFQLLATVAVTVRNELEMYIGDEASIKWPNDLYWRDRKTGGILIENVLRGKDWQWAIIGIGININQTSFGDLKNPVSIKQITGKQTDVTAFAKQLHTAILNALMQLKETGFTSFFDDYNQHLFRRNEVVRLKKETRILHTRINGVNLQGQLSTGIETEEYFAFGEVEWLL
ncbi:BirA family biotin operon repressor/biotin-[acetyl-CoA-carboxylase] ligase [Lacibacter cauensis]|uniref:BirA family biotin operon repressor/biotin-[acetyl-CoA-carboxylase] ligase n=1 Tax=Lacibacter cauensis TaxID=510947 RepID=A0A562SRS1_9BACT|nr:BirA family biotin operon repressor/biotin-[acetyl-CoA-carboxylase] ligase [Lacibacter cauensis]